MTALASQFTHAPARDAECAPVCAHCRLPVPKALRPATDGPAFCCTGCEAAYSIIHSCGLDGFYAIQNRDSAQSRAVGASTHRFSEFDDPAFTRLYCTQAPDGTRRVELLLGGLHCAACVWLIERLPRIVPGVIKATLDFRRACVEISYIPDAVSLSEIARTLDSLGYPPHPARRAARRHIRQLEDRAMLVKLAVAGACAGNIMLLFIALYAGMFEGIDSGHEQLFRWAAMLLNTLCLAWPGMVFARSGWAALRARTINIDVPISLGLYLGGIWGILKTIAGHGDIYFDSISALIFFLLIGRYIQQRQSRFATDALELLFSMTPTSARRVRENGDLEDISTESLAIGDIVEVRPGDVVPADGTVLHGESRIDQSMLTGESLPVTASAGEKLAAGVLNISSVLRFRVDATGEATRIGRLLRTIENAAAQRARIVQLTDRWGAWLLYALLGLATATVLGWWHISPLLAIDRAAALLIATCPCGLGLATPLAMTAAIGGAARKGILIKGGDALERLAANSPRRTVILDKTGTLTLGRLTVLDWFGDESVRSLVRLVESKSLHPVAIALSSMPTPPSDAKISSLTEVPGMGIEACAALAEGRSCGVSIGTERFLQSRGIDIPHSFRQFCHSALQSGQSPVLIARDGICCAAAALGDPLRKDSADAIQRLQNSGWHVRILSGDHPEIVARTARALGLGSADARGGVNPEEKLAFVRDLSADRTVVMVGDGVNDAAALAAASVGIAVRGGAEASFQAADITLTHEGLSPILDLMGGSASTMRTIHWTIATSLFYNVIAATLSILGYISPLLAAIIMPASSLTVVLICLRARRFGARAEQTHLASEIEFGRARQQAVIS
ncbi:MAG: heavy metal translocating P-type ATPase [Phycisphaerales bacterium]|nr:heavy metal translocating P-type ATPase [Planctomycetota bacterium]